MNAQTKLSLPSKGIKPAAEDVALPTERPSPAPAMPRHSPIAELPEPAAADWRNSTGIVLNEQPMTRVYLSGGQVIVRQQAWPDPDVWLRFNLESLPTLIDALSAIRDSNKE